MNIPTDKYFYFRNAGAGFVFAGALGHIYYGFNYGSLGLYILGGCLILSWWIGKKWKS